MNSLESGEVANKKARFDKEEVSNASVSHGVRISVLVGGGLSSALCGGCLSGAGGLLFTCFMEIGRPAKWGRRGTTRSQTL